MSEPLKGKHPALTAISNGATHSKNKHLDFTTKILECAVATLLVAALGVEFGKGLVEASGHFGPGPEIAVQLAGGDHGQ